MKNVLKERMISLASTALPELRSNIHQKPHPIGTSQDIGVTIDDKLNFEKYIAKICRKARNTPLYKPGSGNPFTLTPGPVGELLTINQKLAASLERQNLPKRHPEIFAVDVTTLGKAPLEL